MDDKTLKAMGDPKRFLLMQLMSERSYCVRALAMRSHLSESAVSQHLKILREAGLVYGVKRGYYVHYCVDKEALGKVVAELGQMIETRRQPCDGPFYGCPESEYIRCQAYVPPERRVDREASSPATATPSGFSCAPADARPENPQGNDFPSRGVNDPS